LKLQVNLVTCKPQASLQRHSPGLAGCRQSPSAKWGVHTYAEYAKYGLVTILHMAKGFT
jgi:hypothetical protein